MRPILIALSLLLAVVSCSARQGREMLQSDEDDDRFMLSIRKPTITNTTETTITTEFTTGPNLKKLDFTVKCVNETSACDAPAQGSPITGTLTKGVSLISADVIGLTPNTTYWCYVMSSNTKASLCKGPLPATTLGSIPPPPPPPPPPPAPSPPARR